MLNEHGTFHAVRARGWSGALQQRSTHEATGREQVRKRRSGEEERTATSVTLL